MALLKRILVVVFCTTIGHGIVFAFDLDKKAAAMISVAMTPEKLEAISWIVAGLIGLIGLLIWEGRLSILRLFWT